MKNDRFDRNGCMKLIVVFMFLTYIMPIMAIPNPLNITSGEIWDSYVQKNQGLFAYNMSRYPFVELNKHRFLWAWDTNARSYYTILFDNPLGRPNITCAVMHLTIPTDVAHSSVCQTIRIVQQITNTSDNATWNNYTYSNLDKYVWDNQPCGNVLDVTGNCTETIYETSIYPFCLDGHIKLNITQAFKNEQTYETMQQVHLAFIPTNETGGVDFYQRFISVEGAVLYNETDLPYVEVWWNNTPCGYTLEQLNGTIFIATTTVISTPNNETVFGLIINPIATQLGLSYAGATLLFLVFSAVILGVLGAVQVKDDHKFEIFIAIAFIVITFYTFMGWFYLWLYILILLVAGMLAMKRFSGGA